MPKFNKTNSFKKISGVHATGIDGRVVRAGQHSDRVETIKADVICDYFDNMMSVEAIAKKYSINTKTVHRIFRNENLRMRPNYKLKLAKQVFGELTVVKPVESDNNGKQMWECVCKCGNTKKIRGSDLVSGRVRSCGCAAVAKSLGGIPYQYLTSIAKSAKERGHSFNITMADIVAQFNKQGGLCAFTGAQLQFKLRPPCTNASLDRIRNEIGYEVGNIQWVLKDVNKLRGAFTPENFVKLCDMVKVQNSQKILGKLYGTRVYLGGNIENCADVATWREYCTTELNKLGVVCLNPLVDTFIGMLKEDPATNQQLKDLRAAGKLDEVAEIMKKIVQKDLRMVDISDFLIFTIDADKPTWGTTHEIVQGDEQRKPILIVIDSKQKMPLWFLRFVPKEHIFESHAKLIEYLKKVNDGTVTLDEGRWKILLDVYRYNFK